MAKISQKVDFEFVKKGELNSFTMRSIRREIRHEADSLWPTHLHINNTHFFSFWENAKRQNRSLYFRIEQCLNEAYSRMIRKRLLKQKAFECLEDGGFPNLFEFFFESWVILGADWILAWNLSQRKLKRNCILYYGENHDLLSLLLRRTDISC